MSFSLPCFEGYAHVHIYKTSKLKTLVSTRLDAETPHQVEAGKEEQAKWVDL